MSTVYDLSEGELNYWVAKALEKNGLHYLSSYGKLYTGGYWSGHDKPIPMCGILFEPTRRWEDCGPLLAEFKLVVSTKSAYSTTTGTSYSGDTPQLAICRAVIATKFGESITLEEIPRRNIRNVI